MPNCAVFGCKNNNKSTKGTNIKYFSFPKHEDLAKQWAHVCRRQDKINFKTATVCSEHFSKESFEIPLRQQLLNYIPKNSRNIKPNAIPNRNLPSTNCDDETVNQMKIDRESRKAARCRRKLVANIISENSEILKSKENVIPSNNQEKLSILAPEIDDEMSTYTQREYMEEINSLQKKIVQVENENREWNYKYNNLIKEYDSLKMLLAEEQRKTECTMKVLENLFTEGQIRTLLNKRKKVHWSRDDIAAAISLRSVSPKAYRYMRKQYFPLPALSTLRKWALKLDLSPGILKDVLCLMKTKLSQLNDYEKLTVLSFDEMHISNKICIDGHLQKIFGPHKTCQTVIARGLIGRWKQPLYYDFDQQMKKELINNIIKNLYEIGYIVIAIVSDMAGGNLALWSELKINYEDKNYFNHPSNNDLKIYVFADTPHLLKLIRNHMLDKGFNINGKIIDTCCLTKLLSASTTDLKLAYKISNHNLNVRGSERQNVKMAAQVFSNSVSKSIEWCGLNGFMNNLPWEETSKFIKLINDWFDIFNAKNKYGKTLESHAFGIDFGEQVKILNNVSEIISKLRVGKNKCLLPFQKGILLNNKSLVSLFEYLKDIYGIEYILTNRLTQDVLENFFSYIRGMGSANDHPTPIDFKNRLRWFILGKHSTSIFTMNKNTEVDNSEDLINVTDIDICFSQDSLQFISNIPDSHNDYEDDIESIIASTYSFVELNCDPENEYPEADLSCFELTPDYLDLLNTFDLNTFPERLNFESLKYIAGYIAYRFANKYNYLSTPAKSLNCPNDCWISFMSRGKLLFPSDDLLTVASVLEKEFQNFHGKLLSKETFIFKKLAERTLYKLPKSVNVPYEVILCFVRTRTYIRIRELNKKISYNNCQRKLDKKLYKIANKKNL